MRKIIKYLKCLLAQPVCVDNKNQLNQGDYIRFKSNSLFGLQDKYYIVK
jgi:hypothetical protein